MLGFPIANSGGESVQPKTGVLLISELMHMLFMISATENIGGTFFHLENEGHRIVLHFPASGFWSPTFPSVFIYGIPYKPHI